MGRADPVVHHAFSGICPRCGAEFPACGQDTCDACNAALTLREHEVIAALVSAGGKTAETAKALGITPSTLQTYLGPIFKKLNLKNRTDLVLWAIRGQ